MQQAVSSTSVRPRDRLAILSGLGLITAAAWLYVVLRGSSGGHFGPRLAMWMGMMVAMMVPTAVPTTLVYSAVARKASTQGSQLPPAFVLVAGYTSVWVLFSVVASAAQRGLEELALLSPMMVANSPTLGGVLLIGAGVYQLTPLKQACLRHCRTPAHFFARNWRAGASGAFWMGSKLGVYCLGCCWVLMGLLFVGGVMNLLWVAAIAVFVLLEKVVPFGVATGRIAGATLILVGVVSLVR